MNVYIYRAENKRTRIAKHESISSQMRFTSAMCANQLKLFCESFVLFVSQFDWKFFDMQRFTVHSTVSFNTLS